jgi:methylglutaconyl-CoA hydratase
MPQMLELFRESAVLRLRLNRPALHNAFDAELIAELTAALIAAGADPATRVVVLEGAGASFSAGADLNWMRGMATASEAENREDALALARLMRTLDELPKPTVARVHGAAFGGGVGLVACCDIAIAVDTAKFGLTEVKLGLVPAVISPYVVAAIGPRHARRLFVSGEIFEAADAARIGLVHQITFADKLDENVERMADVLMFRVADLDEKDLILADDRGLYFTTPHFNGYPAVLLRIPTLLQIDRDELRDLVVGAWLTRAQKRVAKAWLAENEPEVGD